MMNAFRNIINSVTSSISSRISEFQSPSIESPMDGVLDQQITNERTAYKIKGFFDLAKQEIAKAIRAEEWGITDEAISHYKSAQGILFEASSISVPSYITPREHEKVKSFKQKVSEWQDQVADRLQVLSRRSGGAVSTRKEIVHEPRPVTSHKGSQVSRKRIDAPESSKPNRGSAYESNLTEIINSTVVDRSPSIKWDDIAGLEKAKQSLLEMVILPTKRRDLFTGLRRPARGLLLFGPPGNGKTMLAKAVASESEATFFNISASSLTSKWVGEAEKLVRVLFEVAVSRQPSVIFMDEIDSIMSTRMANENDASRRLKSEFLVQFDGVTSNSSDLVIVIGATNKPQELDDAVLRRLVKRIYVPLPDEGVRKLLLKTKLKGQAFFLRDSDLQRLVLDTEGYSGSDLQALCEEAAMMPIRELGSNVLTVKEHQVRPLKYEDFKKAMGVIRPSLSKGKWQDLERWNDEFGAN